MDSWIKQVGNSTNAKVFEKSFEIHEKTCRSWVRDRILYPWGEVPHWYHRIFSCDPGRLPRCNLESLAGTNVWVCFSRRHWLLSRRLSIPNDFPRRHCWTPAIPSTDMKKSSCSACEDEKNQSFEWGGNYPSYLPLTFTARLLRPFRRRRLKTCLPLEVAMRLRNPCDVLRFFRLGW